LLKAKGAEIVCPLIGNYATSMEVAGASLSIMKLDDELESLLRAPADNPFWRNL
jgi:dihydroxyacetone kinase-like protein